MNNNDVFITRFMLSSYLDDRKDYVDLVIPFLTNCLPREKNAPIDIKEVTTKLNCTYDLDVPHNMVKSMLNRLCKKRNEAKIRREDGNYYVVQPYDLTEFDLKHEKIKKSIADVIAKMQDYLKNERFVANVTPELTQQYLITFLNTNNYTVYDNADVLQDVVTVKGDKVAAINYNVAQFVLKEYKAQSPEYDSLIEIIKGFLTAKSIYYFMNAENATNIKKIDGTTFILDTRLLIGALGLNLPQEKEATDELLELITKNGGKLATFDYYVQELAGIITKYEKDPTSRVSLSLDSFKRQKYGSSDAHVYLGKLNEKIEALKITILPRIYFDDSTANQNWLVDCTELRNKLSEFIDYSNRNDEYFSRALENDAYTIESIAYMRKVSRPCNVFNCKYIFVTPNSAICRVVLDMFKTERFSANREFSFTITDIDLTSILWLSTFGSKTDFPQLKLIENAYSACAPSRDVMAAFLSKIKSCEDDETITKESALLLRTYHSCEDDLVELTGNDPDKVDEKIIRSIENRIRNELKKEAAAGLHKSEAELNKKANEVEAQAQENAKKAKDYQDREFILNKREEDIRRKSGDVQKANTILEKFHRNAEKISTFVQNAVLYILCTITITILAGVTGFCSIQIYHSVPASISGLVSAAVSILGFVSLMYAAYMWLLPRYRKIAMKCYDSVYSKIISFFMNDSDNAA